MKPSSSLSYLLPYANINWQDNLCPYSPQFDDTYWSQSFGELESIGGLAEKTHVFLEGNKLKQRWQQLKSNDEFTILETGFGFGLNFILSLELKCQTQKAFTLQYVAFEQFPVSPEDLVILNKSLNNNYLSQLIDKYPPPIPGMHHIWFSDDVCLTLVLGDINRTLPDLIANVDACFLDGFSPSKNESMWTDSIYTEITKRLRSGASCSSYSVAGHLRRGLASKGLEVAKTKGFGKKAEMLFASSPGTWKPNRKKSQKVAIVGAGLSGIFIAQALIKRRIETCLYDTENEILGAVKAISQLGIYPQLSATPQKNSIFSLHGFNFTINHIAYFHSGRLLTIDSEKSLTRAEQIDSQFPDNLVRLLNADQASSIAGIDISKAALFFPEAGWLNPKELNLATQSEIKLGTHVNSISYDENQWSISTANGEKDNSDIIILTTGAQQFSELDQLNLVSVRGQSLQLELSGVEPKTIIDDAVSLFPNYMGSYTLSATYSRNDLDKGIRQEDTDWLIAQLAEITSVTPSSVVPQVGHRMTSRDRMPVCSKVPNWPALQQYCQSSQRSREKPFSDYQDKLYCSVGFGSHGATMGPYCAELLAREINQEPRSALPNLTSAIRFALRDSGTKFNS